MQNNEYVQNSEDIQINENINENILKIMDDSEARKEIKQKFQIMTPDIMILIIDDYAPDVRLVQEAIKKGKMVNINTDSVPNGIEGLKYLRKESKYKDAITPDIILLDLNMPLMGGHKFLEVIKKDDQLKKIPVIVMTVSSSEDDIDSSYKEHANAYIIKPIKFGNLIKAMISVQNFWFVTVRLPSIN
jgi:chemotaxis family two-component system response regulator Rcp1